MTVRSGVRVLIFLDGLDTRLNRSPRLILNLQRGVFQALQKSFVEVIITEPEEILVVLSERSLHLAKTLGFDPFLRVTILLLKEGEYLSWDLLAQLDKEALATVIQEWLTTMGVDPKTMVLFQWQQADHIRGSTLSSASGVSDAHNFVNPALLVTADLTLV